jgi:hypothetical protein
MNPTLTDLVHSLGADEAPHPNLVYDGKTYININNIYDSKIWPELFAGLTSKQSKRSCVTERMQRGTEYIFVLPRKANSGAKLVLEDRPYLGTKEPKQAHVLISMDHLMTCPIQDPRTCKHKGAVSQGFKTFKTIWDKLGDDSTSEDTTKPQPSEPTLMTPKQAGSTSEDTTKPQQSQPTMMTPKQAGVTKESTVNTNTGPELATIPVYMPFKEPLQLTDAEKFRDKDGNVFELAFFGERTHDGCYVDASDVGQMLGTKEFRKTLLDNTSRFVPGQHFAYIPMEPIRGEEESASPLIGIGWSSNPDPSIRWRRVLTYEGTLRALFTARKNAIADYYCSWATQKLFTHHLGTNDQRSQLAAELMGYPVDTVRKFLSSCCASEIAGIYMWSLGTVGDLRDKLKFDRDHQLPDSFMVAKVGSSEDIHAQRSGALKCELKKLGISMELYLFTCTDPERVGKAEKEVLDWFEEREETIQVGQKFVGFTELVAFAPGRNDKKAIKTQFQNISLRYGGATNQQIKDIQQQLQLSETMRKAAEGQLETERKASVVLAENAMLWKKLYENRR